MRPADRVGGDAGVKDGGGGQQGVEGAGLVGQVLERKVLVTLVKYQRVAL